MRIALLILIAFLPKLTAAAIGLETLAAYIHTSNGLAAQYGTTSTTYFTNLDANNVGTFGWTFTNSTASTMNGVQFFGFVDADIDRDANTFFNEYGLFVDLSLPTGSPGGAIGATSWQIDEPGFVFGTILTDLAAASLRNANFVPSSAPDDVSLALGFVIGNLAPGQTATLTLRISSTSIGGLQQFDPDSQLSFFLNGYASVSSITNPPPNTIPEPANWALCAAGIAALSFLRRR